MFCLFVSLFVSLFKVIEVAKSSVDIMGSKVEVKLKKADPISWASLQFNEAQIS